jgi:hypothetical protein
VTVTVATVVADEDWAGGRGFGAGGFCGVVAGGFGGAVAGGFSWALTGTARNRASVAIGASFIISS